MRKIVVFKKTLELFQQYQVIQLYGQIDKRLFKLRFYFMIVVWSFPAVIGNLFYLWRVFTKALISDTLSLVSILESLHVNGELLAVGATGCISVYYGDEIVEFFYHLGVHKFSEPEILAEVYKKHDKMTNQIILSTRVICYGRIIFNLYDNTFCEAKQKFNDERYFCGLLLPCWYPFNMNILLKAWVFAGSDLILAVYLPLSALGYFTVFGVSDLIVLRMQKMKRMLNELDFEGNHKIIDKQLMECVEYHSEIWDLVKMMNNSLGSCHACHYSLVSIIIALLEYQLTVSSDITVFFQLCIWIIGEYMVCSAGQNIENEREAMATALYLTPWYKLPVKLRKPFTIFLAKMQIPLHFEARPMIHLNFEFLMKVLKGSYSFLMFLKSKSF